MRLAAVRPTAFLYESVMNEKVLRLQGRAVRASGDEKRAVGRGAFADYDAGAHGWASEKKEVKLLIGKMP